MDVCIVYCVVDATDLCDLPHVIVGHNSDISIVCLLCSWSPGAGLLDAAEICDLLKGIVLVVCCVVMHYVDVSMMYHVIRGQTVIKLYIFFNMLDVCTSRYLALKLSDESLRT